MFFRKLDIVDCNVDLGECHLANDFGFYKLWIKGRLDTGHEIQFFCRLHVTEPLDGLVLADPSTYADGGYHVNSAGSPVLVRNKSYGEMRGNDPFVQKPSEESVFYRIERGQLLSALLKGYDHNQEIARIRKTKSSRLRIAFTCHDPNLIGGGNKVIFRWINWFTDLGHDVTIYSCGSQVPYWKQVKAQFRFFDSYEQMLKAITEEVVIIFSMWHLCPLLRFKNGDKLIFHIRQTYEANNYGIDAVSMFESKPIIELIESLPIGVLAVSPHLMQIYREHHGLLPDYIPNGVDLKIFYPGKEKKLNGNKVIIKSVGEPSYFLKGADVLKKALCIFATQHPEREFLWEIVTGYLCKIPDWSDVPQNLSINVTTGLKEVEMRHFYQTADVFVNPSLYEGFGLPTLEAMACGIPVIHCDNGGLQEIVIDKENGLLVPVKSPDKMVEALEDILAKRTDVNRLVEGALKTAEKFSLHASFSSFLRVFQDKFACNYEIDRVLSIQSGLCQSFKSVEEAPLVSVVLPSYNQAQYLSQALDCLQKQTYVNWEAIVVNDGSTDNTQEVIEKYALIDSRIKGFTKINGGITSALNEGLKHASGKYFCWLSSDDLFYPEKLQLQIESFRNLSSEYGIVYGNFDLLIEEEKRIETLPDLPPLLKGCEFAEGLRFDFIDGCTIMIPMSIMREVEGFNPYFRHAQDFELWVRIASLGYKFHLLPQKLTIRRVHKSQSSTNNIIFCQFDAISIIDYYLRHFHLLEVYRGLDFRSQEDRNIFIQHI